MDKLRMGLALRLSRLRVPYVIGRKNILANIHMALVWVLTPPTREGEE